jgi:aminoglycoside phosphotransferase (APT) family kinase protein
MNECLTHGDLTPEHIYIKRKNGRPEFAEVIDWGDAKIAPPVYDFVTFWMTVCNRERECFQSFLEGYAEGKSLNGQLMLAMIFLHPFRQDLILEAWEQDGRQPFFNSWEELSEWLWPLQNEK